MLKDIDRSRASCDGQDTLATGHRASEIPMHTSTKKLHNFAHAPDHSSSGYKNSGAGMVLIHTFILAAHP